jgi:choline kinase
MRVRKAVIPAAGLGTRFLPATKAQPKEMLPIVDKPTLQYIIEEGGCLMKDTSSLALTKYNYKYHIAFALNTKDFYGIPA